MMNTSIIYYLVFRFFVIFHTSSAHMGLCSVDGCSGRTIFIELSAEGMVSSSTGRVLYRHDHALFAARPSAVSLHPRFSRAAFFRGCTKSPCSRRCSSAGRADRSNLSLCKSVHAASLFSFPYSFKYLCLGVVDRSSCMSPGRTRCIFVRTCLEEKAFSSSATRRKFNSLRQKCRKPKAAFG